MCEGKACGCCTCTVNTAEVTVKIFVFGSILASKIKKVVLLGQLLDSLRHPVKVRGSLQLFSETSFLYAQRN